MQALFARGCNCNAPLDAGLTPPPLVLGLLGLLGLWPWLPPLVGLELFKNGFATNVEHTDASNRSCSSKHLGSPTIRMLAEMHVANSVATIMIK